MNIETETEKYRAFTAGLCERWKMLHSGSYTKGQIRAFLYGAEVMAVDLKDYYISFEFSFLHDIVDLL